MKIKEFILKEVEKKGKIETQDLVDLFHVSRQTASQHLRELTHEKKLLKVGTTKKVYYVSFSFNRKAALQIGQTEFSSIRRIKNLSEDQVFNEVVLNMNLKKLLSKNAFAALNYAFTEMLNNAIDHSKSEKVQIKVRSNNGSIEFDIIDLGIGVFESIRKNFRLQDHHEAVEHLLKGKQTTAPKKHAGEGIFFTSKIADRFCLKSAEFKLVFDHPDLFLAKNEKPVKGTHVEFSLKQRSKKNLKKLFDAYSNEEFEFDKTEVIVHIAKKEGEYVSRSEAKRILLGLEKFKRIVFDFKHVSGIGQGFADEIFRVFKAKYPQILLETIHANQAIQLMMSRIKSYHLK